MAATVKPAVAKLLDEDVVFGLVVLLTLSSFPICGVVVMFGIVTGT